MVLRKLYYFRDQQGLEVDFLFPSRHGELWMVECNAAKTVQPTMAGPLLSLQRPRSRPGGRLLVVHRSSAGAPATQGLAPGVQAVEVRALMNLLAGGAGPALRSEVHYRGGAAHFVGTSGAETTYWGQGGLLCDGRR